MEYGSVFLFYVQILFHVNDVVWFSLVLALKLIAFLSR